MLHTQDTAWQCAQPSTSTRGHYDCCYRQHTDTLSPDLQNENIFFFLPTLITVTAATHALPSEPPVPCLATYCVCGSLLTSLEHDDLLSPFRQVRKERP